MNTKKMSIFENLTVIGVMIGAILVGLFIRGHIIYMYLIKKLGGRRE